ncbi:unnamed protein product [Macrosiphum euphorbiae]|uniref:Uncharacterized protein n=1 Tax=Macrosiphum euphorbiae TaxID=13131 RepID=A0AAV0XNC2_9HEMI|nr:unnamed protein product [Macrosiphum euphorbiae]
MQILYQISSLISNVYGTLKLSLSVNTVYLTNTLRFLIPECHIELENTAMVVDNNPSESMFWEELSLFNNKFISPSTST